MTLEALATSAMPWSQEKLNGLETMVRGHLLKDWGLHVQRRRGLEAVARVRQLTGIRPPDLPDQPRLDAWYPSRYQIALTDAIVQEYLDGDYLALEDLLFADATRKRERVVRWIAARVGPATAFKRAPAGHREVYSRGVMDAQVKRGHATLMWRGALVFENPTWQMLQMMAMRLMMRVMKRRLITLEGTTPSSESFEINVAWR